MSTAAIFKALLLISLLIPIFHTQELSNTSFLATEEFTLPTSRYVALIGDAAFNWFGARDLCIGKGYAISQINTTLQHQQIANIIVSSSIPITDCWLGAFGFFIPNISIAWTWDAFDRNISWNHTFASQLMVEPQVDVDPQQMQGLLIKINSEQNNDAIWSYDNAELSQNEANGRRCVVCLDITSNATTALSPTPIPGPTSNPIAISFPTPTSSPVFSPTLKPSLNPTYPPTTARPTINWDNIDQNTGEIKLDQKANQSCDWRELECELCLDKLRIAMISTAQQPQHVDQLLEQYDTMNDCECFGGIGIEETTENNKTVLTIHTMNASTFTFAEEEDDEDPDDITLSITNWRGGSKTCQITYYVNRNAFLGIKARNILMVEFDITGISILQDHLPGLFRTYFRNDSVAMEEAKNVTVHVDEQDETHRRLQAAADDNVHVSVIIFTESGEQARKAQTDLEASETLPLGWDEHVEDIIHNETGADPDTAHLSNIKYSLLSSYNASKEDEDTDTDHGDDEDTTDDDEEDKIRRKRVIGGTLLVVIIFSCILASILIITYVVYSHCKDKKRMAYQKPQVTRDNISEITDTSDCEEGDIDCVNVEEGQIEEHEPMLRTHDHLNVSERVIGLKSLNVSRRIEHGHLDALNDEREEQNDADDLLLYPGGKTPYDARGGGKDMLSSVAADTVTVSSSFSAKTSLMNFDLSSTMDVDELITTLTNKVCSSNYTRLIPHDELWIEEMIGKGHYGEVYRGTYDANRVAIKTFNDCQQKQYARSREIYSEVVLASTMPSHPNVVQILGITRNPLNIVMSYYEGGNLQRFIYQRTRPREYSAITLNSIMNLMQKIADGLLFLHNNKIVHRDIAARNVLLGRIDETGQIRENSKVVISDFGMTRSMHEATQWEQQTKQKIGAIKWMAPESIVKQKYSYKTDVYMFGVIMFEIMHGKEPYTSAKYEAFTLPILAINIVNKSMRPQINPKEEMERIARTATPNDEDVIVVKQINALMTNCWHQSTQNRPSMINVLHELNDIYDTMLGLN
eukprot:252199_1